VRQWGGNGVVLQGGNLHKDIEEALDGKKLSLVLDTVVELPWASWPNRLNLAAQLSSTAFKAGSSSYAAQGVHLPWS